MTANPGIEILAPARRFGELIHLPGDARYGWAKTPWNLAVRQEPAMVALPISAAEVVRAVGFARSAGLKVVPQSTGHNAGPLAGRTEAALLLRMSEFTGVSIDAERRIARVLGGTTWSQVADAAAGHGLAALHGSGPDIAVAGYTLGGGLSWYARQHGLACNQLVAAEIVLADGTLQRVHANHMPEIFWAIRGGGGNFGVVTALEFTLLPLTQVYAGVLLWDAARAGEVCRAWARWTHDLPERASTALRLLGRPRSPHADNVFPMRQSVVIDGAILGDPDTAEQLLSPLRALHPSVDTFHVTRPDKLTRMHFDPELPSATVSDHLLLEEFTEDAADAFVAAAGLDADTSLLSAEIRHLGGALSRSDPESGALNHLSGTHAGFFIAAGNTEDHRVQGAADTGRAFAALQPWSNGRRFLNFTEQPTDPSNAYDPDTLARLRTIRAQADPGGMFLANHTLD